MTLQAGSCLRVTIGKGGQPACWRTQDGLLVTIVGERNAEGFGLVAIGAAALADRTMQPTAVDPRHRVPAGVDKAAAGEASGDAFVEGLRKESLRQELAVKAKALARDDARRRHELGWTADKPTRSQLGGLRQAARPRCLRGGQRRGPLVGWSRAGRQPSSAVGRQPHGSAGRKSGPRLRGTRSGGPRRALR